MYYVVKRIKQYGDPQVRTTLCCGSLNENFEDAAQVAGFMALTHSEDYDVKAPEEIEKGVYMFHTTFYTMVTYSAEEAVAA